MRAGKDVPLSRDENIATVRPVHAAKNADQGGLAGAVLADDGVDLSGPHIEVDAVKGNRCIEPLADAVRPKERKVHWSTRHECNLHLIVGEPSTFDNDVIVERDRAIAHRHVIMALGAALAATLRVWSG